MRELFGSTGRAFAKINLGLRICGKREDGYHILDSIMQSISLCDGVSLHCCQYERGESFSPVELTVTGEDSLPLDERNTAFSSAALFLAEAGLTHIGVRIHVDKVIPSQAGLGGASADAAAVFFLLHTAFPDTFSAGELLLLAGRIGADVPFCLKGGLCRCRGTGDILEPLPPFPPLPILLVKPPVGISTPWAYRRCDEIRSGGGSDSRQDRAYEQIFDGTPESLWQSAGLLYNDLEEAVRDEYPDIPDIRTFLEKNGARFAAMTGSGSCVFGVFSDESRRDLAYKKARTNFPSTFFTACCSTVSIR